jgi:SSS family solute:Na+ symporter
VTVLDYAVIVLYAAGMLAVGSYYARRVKTADDYLLGGRSMSPFMIGLSLFATLTSTLSYLALPGEMIKNGPVVFSELLSLPFVFLIVGWVLIPRIMRQRVTSGYELLESRLGLTGRLLGAGMFVLLRVFWMASILYATAHAVLIPLLELDPKWMPAVNVAMAVITVVYTVEGGLKAVVVTDAVQAILMFLGAAVTIVVVSVALGGVSAWWPSYWPAHWPELKVLPEPGVSRTVLGAFAAMLVWMTCTAGSDQMSIQRYLATRDTAAARRSFAIQLLSTVFSMVLLGLAGLAVLGYFIAVPHDLPKPRSVATEYAAKLAPHEAVAGGPLVGALEVHPDALPKEWRLTKDADKLMPHFIVIGLPAGLTGLVIAAILAAAMSSLSSGLNSSSAVIVTDFVGRAGGRRMTPEGEVRLARYVSVAVGVVAVGLSLLVGSLAGNLLELCFKVVNLLTAPIFVLFFLALFVPRATPVAAVAATVASVTTAAVVAFGWEAKWFLWSPPAALLAGVTVGTLASLVTSSRPTSARP